MGLFISCKLSFIELTNFIQIIHLDILINFNFFLIIISMKFIITKLMVQFINCMLNFIIKIINFINLQSITN